MVCDGFYLFLHPAKPEFVAHIAGQNIHDARVASPMRHDHVRQFDVIADVLVVHGLDGAQILDRNVFDAAPTLIDVAGDTAQQADIRLYAHIQLEKHQFAQALVIEHMNALYDEHIRRIDQLVRIGAAMLGVVIALAGNRFSVQKKLDILQKQIMIEDFRLVVVEQRPFLKGEAGVVPIIAVMVDNEAPFANGPAKLLRQRAFAAPAGAADSDDDHGPHRALPCFFPYDSRPDGPCQDKMRHFMT